MKSTLYTVVAIMSVFVAPSLLAVTYYEETEYRIIEKSHWECPNKKRFDTQAEAQKECGKDAKLFKETIETEVKKS